MSTSEVSINHLLIKGGLKMNLIGIVVIVAVAVGLLVWKKCGGGCATKEKKEKK